MSLSYGSTSAFGTSNVSISLQPTCNFYPIPGLVITDTVSCPPGFYCPFLRPELGEFTYHVELARHRSAKLTICQLQNKQQLNSQQS